MRVEDGSNVARVLEATDDEIEWMANYLSFPDTRAHWKRRGSSRVEVFNRFTRSFPAGLLSPLRRAAREEGRPPVEVVDYRRFPAIDEEADLAWLEPYQREALSTALRRRRGILWMAMASGKTEIAIGLSRAVPGPWLLLCDSSSLVVQAAERWALRSGGARAGDVGAIADGRWETGRCFTAATFQSIRAALVRTDPAAMELLKSAVGLIVDEAHVLPADSFLDVADACPAPFRIGLSATPMARGDRRGTVAVGCLGPVIYRMTSPELIALGKASRPSIRMVRVEQTEFPCFSWRDVYEARVIHGQARNAALVQIAKVAAKPAIIFVRDVKTHGKILERMLWAEGLKADFVNGAHSTGWRKSVAGALRRGAIDVLVASAVFEKGIDIPELRGVINGAGYQSTIVAVQKLGRGMRVDRDADGNVREGGQDFELWDIDDVGNKWLEKHSRTRRGAYEEEGFDVRSVRLAEVIAA